MLYNNLHGILSIGLLYMLNSENFFSSGANVAVAGLHLYVFLSLNVNFGACTINTLNVTLSNRTKLYSSCSVNIMILWFCDISDTTRTRTRNLFRHKHAPIPLSSVCATVTDDFQSSSKTISVKLKLLIFSLLLISSRTQNSYSVSETISGNQISSARIVGALGV